MRMNPNSKNDNDTARRHCPPQISSDDPSRTLPIGPRPTVPAQDHDTMANRLTGGQAVVKECQAIF